MSDSAAPEHTVDEKALAVARLEAMRGTLEHVGDRWSLVVRRLDSGGTIKSTGTDLVELVRSVHDNWAPGYAEQRKSLFERAARFQVAEVQVTDNDFTGIEQAPHGKSTVLAHLYDGLIDLRDEGVRLWFYAMQPAEWCLQCAPMNDPIRAPSLVKMCHRLDAWMHKHYLLERSSILEAAKELNLVQPAPPESEPELPVVVMPSPEPVPVPKAVPGIAMHTVVLVGVTALTIGLVLGALLSSRIG